MKKLIMGLAVLFTAVFCFAETVVIEDIDKVHVNSEGFIFGVGDLFYSTNRLNEYANTKKDSKQMLANGVSFELGSFKSDEDGLFDFVESNTFGLRFGKVNSNNNYAWKDRNDYYTAVSDAEFGSINFKEAFGPQVNFFLFSAGALFGSNIGFDWLKMRSEGLDGDFTYKERRIFFDFVTEPYFSFNIHGFAKLYFSTQFDFPILRVRFIKDSYYNDYLVRWDWFRNDVPTVFKMGAVFFF